MTTKIRMDALERAAELTAKGYGERWEAPR